MFLLRNTLGWFLLSVFFFFAFNQKQDCFHSHCLFSIALESVSISFSFFTVLWES